MKIGKLNFNINTIFVIAIGILIILLLKECNKNENLKLQAAVDKQNQLALKDSVRVIKNSLGQEIFVKNTLIADRKSLMELNSGLAKDLKTLEGNVLFIQSSIAKIKTPEPIVLTNNVVEYPDGLRELSWKHFKAYNDSNSRSLEGNSRFTIDTTGGKFTVVDKGTTITKDEMSIKLITGLTELDKSYQIYVKTDYPGVSFSSIDGAILDKKRFMKQSEPDFIWGPSVFLGMGIDPKHNSAGPQIGVGLSATWNLNKYIKKLFGK